MGQSAWVYMFLAPDSSKEQFHQKLKYSRCQLHPHADGKSVEVSGASQQNGFAAFSFTTEVDERGSIHLVWCNPSIRKPLKPELMWKDFIYTVL